ncbi:MAG: hypothetical protein RMJ32_01750 [Aquificaceae bacterium]|nr:hypothetical protein [Aquificaceae bacterium]
MRKLILLIVALFGFALVSEAKTSKNIPRKHVYAKQKSSVKKSAKVKKVKAKRPPRYAKRINDPKMGEYLKLEGMLRNAQGQE